MSSPSLIQFPPDFLWGSATSSFQIEGHPLADGACESNWYRWTHTPGKIDGGDNADVACDHYHRVKEDVALMKKMGLQSYRFSISWPRVMPKRGQVNQKALDFYRSLMEELTQAGIKPMATLFHWEVPVWCEGDWENRETVFAFEEYAKAVFKALGPYADYWVTLNEPLVVAVCGYMWGFFPPGKKDAKAYGQVTHHLNLAQALAMRAYRELGVKAPVGPAMALSTNDPVTQDPKDIAQAERMDAIHIQPTLNPLVGRGYPPAFLDFTGKLQGPVEEDLKLMQYPVDFLGVNHYFRGTARYRQGANILDNDGFVAPGTPTSDLGWEVRPKAFGDILTYVWEKYGFKAIYVTENGMATRKSKRSHQQTLADDVRIHYLGTYLAEARRVMEKGVPVKGYYLWSLMDNFEWAMGYDPCFGLIAVDPATQERQWKDSAYWYQKVIQQNGFDLSALPKDPSYERVPDVKNAVNA